MGIELRTIQTGHQPVQHHLSATTREGRDEAEYRNLLASTLSSWLFGYTHHVTQGVVSCLLVARRDVVRPLLPRYLPKSKRRLFPAQCTAIVGTKLFRRPTVVESH